MVTMVEQPSVKKLVLIVMGRASKCGRFMGITRIQKLIYLLSITPEYKEIENELRYQPLHYGPYSAEVSLAIDTLVEYKYILSTPLKLETQKLKNERGDEESISEMAENKEYFETKEYRLSPVGSKVADHLYNSLSIKNRKVMDNIIKQYGGLELKELLRRVYAIAPDELLARSTIRSQLGY